MADLRAHPEQDMEHEVCFPSSVSLKTPGQHSPWEYSHPLHNKRNKLTES
jgi:hypothetical protein